MANFRQMMTNKFKNTLLLSTYIISQIPSLFFGTNLRYNLAIFVDRSTRLDFFFLYYTISINFLILSYALHFNIGVSKKVTKFIFIVCVLDFLHLMLFAMQGLGMAKIGVAFIIYTVWQKVNKGK